MKTREWGHLTVTATPKAEPQARKALLKAVRKAGWRESKELPLPDGLEIAERFMLERFTARRIRAWISKDGNPLNLIDVVRLDVLGR